MNAKIGYWIGGIGLLGLTGYLAYLKFGNKPDAPVLDAPVVKPDGSTVTKDSKGGATVTAPPKPAQPVRENSGFVSNGNTDVRKMGDKAFSGKKGANAYKSASANTTNVYKYYAPGKYIGTWLGSDGTFTKIIVEETGTFSNSNKTVWVPTTDLVF